MSGCSASSTRSDRTGPDRLWTWVLATGDADGGFEPSWGPQCRPRAYMAPGRPRSYPPSTGGVNGPQRRCPAPPPEESSDDTRGNALGGVDAPRSGDHSV